MSTVRVPNAEFHPILCVQAFTGWTRKRRRRNCCRSTVTHWARRAVNTFDKARANVRLAINAFTNMRWPMGHASMLANRNGPLAVSIIWAKSTYSRNCICGIGWKTGTGNGSTIWPHFCPKVKTLTGQILVVSEWCLL